MITLKNKNTRPQGMLFDPMFFGLNPKSHAPKIHTTNRIFHNILKNEDGFIIELAAPGFAKEDFKIDINENTLKVSLAKESDSTETYVRKEYDFHSFDKSFTLPIDTDKANVEAKYELGILSIVIPLKEKITHKINVL